MIQKPEVTIAQLRKLLAAERETIATLTGEETIVSAALRLGHLIVSAPPPARHHTLINGLGLATGVPRLTHMDDQGFLTNIGRWVDRVTAKQIAIANGQLIAESCAVQGDELYSEDLW